MKLGIADILSGITLVMIITFIVGLSMAPLYTSQSQGFLLMIHGIAMVGFGMASLSAKESI